MSKFLNYAAIGGVAIIGTGILAVAIADGNVSRASSELQAEVAARNESARAWASERQAELDAQLAQAEAEAAAAAAEEEAATESEAVAEDATAEEPAAEDTMAASEGSDAPASEGEDMAESEAAEAPATESEAVAEGEADEEPAAETEATADADAADETPPETVDTAAAEPTFDTTPSDGPFGLGRAATEDEVAAWNIDIRFDGQGLPEGSGSVADGEVIYQEQCAACHGTFGEAIGRWPVLAGGEGTLTNDRPVKTIGSYWPYLSTVYDYVHRAMPFGNAQSLSDDDVYAVTAYLLNLNFLVDDDFVLSNETFAEVADLPNEAEFFMDDREEAEFPQFVSADVCMENCKEGVEITKRAAVLDVTPDAEGGGDLESGGGGSDTVQDDTESGVDVGDTAEAPAPEEAEAEGEEMAQADTADAAPEAEAETGPDPELVAAGEKLFRQCQSCHQIGEGAKNRVGPILNGVVGATIGSVEDFKYSNVFKDAHDAGEIWGDENLAAFLMDPRGTMKGTKMSFRGLKEAEEAEAMIAYLRAASE